MSDRKIIDTILDLRSPIGLVAGGGQFPFEFVEIARAHGLEVVVVGFKGDTSPELQSKAVKFKWLRVGQLGKLIKYFSDEGVRDLAFLGGVSRSNLLKSFRPDFRAMLMLAKLKTWRDDAVLRATALECEKAGLSIFSPAILLDKSVPQEGLLTKRDLNEEERAAAREGWIVAKAIGAHDIGQTVVLYRGTVVAVEAVEGTDATIKRAGDLSQLSAKSSSERAKILRDGTGQVAVKVSKPLQDKRLDIPTIGIQTLESLADAGVSAMLIEAGKTMIVDPVPFVEKANSYGLAIRACSGQDSNASQKKEHPGVTLT